MENSKFSPAPRIRGAAVGSQSVCSVEWHPPFNAGQVEQFDGTWLDAFCPRCNWEAMHSEPGNELRRQAFAQHHAAALNRRLIGSGITPRFRNCTFDSFEVSTDAQAHALENCRMYAVEFEESLRRGRGLLLVGNVGTGKTHLACAIVQHVIRRFEAYAVITSAAEICRVMRSSFSKGAGFSDLDVLEELAGPDLLVIDEVGVQSGSDFSPGVLGDVIDRRYQQLRPTILISNRKPTEMTAFVGDRAVDRMRQGGGSVVGFSWASRRSEV